MKANTVALLDFLGQSNARFTIPAYQRVYSWRERQCTELWVDLMRAARKDRTHFLGPILYTNQSDTLSNSSCNTPDHTSTPCTLSIIDGQQRVTTIMLLLHALSRWLDSRRSSEDIMGQNAFPYTGNDLQARFLWENIQHHQTECVNPNKSRVQPTDRTSQSKLTLSRSDQATFDAVLRNASLPNHPSQTILDNVKTFAQLMDDESFSPEVLWHGLQNLTIIAVEVEHTQAVSSYFESLNSKGLPLTVADLARNYLLLTENHSEQTRLFNTYWEPMQEIFAPDPGSLRLDSSIRAWLSIRLRGARILGVEQTYSSFKRYVEDKFDGNKESILYELRGFSVMWAENFRYHGVKKFKSSYDWAVNGAPILTAGRPLVEPEDKDYARRLRERMDNVNRYW